MKINNTLYKKYFIYFICEKNKFKITRIYYKNIINYILLFISMNNIVDQHCMSIKSIPS